jgi:hypothetical protein
MEAGCNPAIQMLWRTPPSEEGPTLVTFVGPFLQSEPRDEELKIERATPWETERCIYRGRWLTNCEQYNTTCWRVRGERGGDVRMRWDSRR